jgi:hypothetical protein
MHATNLSVKQYFNGHYFYPKCKSDNGKYPDGFFQNEDCNCFPQHDKCSKGYHSHENDETSRCIPDKTPCEPGYIINPSFPECGQKDGICKEHPMQRDARTMTVNQYHVIDMGYLVLVVMITDVII